MNKIFKQSIFINSMKLDFLMLARIELKAFCVYGRRDNRYTTAPELSQVASFSCFADLEFYSSVHLSKITENFACLNGFSSGVRQFFWSYLKYSFQRTKFFFQSLFSIFIRIDFLILSWITLETFCVLGRRDNRYTTAPDLDQVASFSCFARMEFLSSVPLSKVTENFHMSDCILITCQAIFLELV